MLKIGVYRERSPRFLLDDAMLMIFIVRVRLREESLMFVCCNTEC